MSLFVKITALLLLPLVFLYCRQKKPATPRLESWLEAHFPGRFQVVSTSTDDAIRNLSFKVKKSIVAEKSAPNIQALLHYDLRAAELELNPADVEAAMERARRYRDDASAFLQALHTAGAPEASAGIRDGKLSVLFFEEPEPAQRRRSLEQVETALRAWPAGKNTYDVELLLSEQAVAATEKGVVLPLAFWLDAGEAYRKQVVFSVSCPNDQAFKASSLEKKWEFNAYSNRFSIFHEQSLLAAKEWLAKHGYVDYQIAELSESDQPDDKPGSLIFNFTAAPAEGKNGESLALEVRFDIDEKSVEGIRRTVANQ